MQNRFTSKFYDVSVKDDANFGTKCIYLNPLASNPHKTTLIFLHGLGDSGEGFFDLFSDWDRYQLTPLSCRVVLPTAPSRPLSRCDG